ncbi:1282_t:CDS:2 [Scutellospora calospora]|uniref:1282_t:CDS:1 n=1 Tax=Scutellospora calospora TaxID=85575 RepID=A0ACA9K1C4_9GLOM|nr:1282_t:CDS:2 [Scutellospora calospora]
MPKYRNKKSTTVTSVTLTNFKPSFPPQINIDELISKSLSNTNSKYNRTPNPFIIYRKVFNREISKLKPDLSLQQISTKASESWYKEPEYVKNSYRKLAEDAKIRFKNIAPLSSVSDIDMDTTLNVNSFNSIPTLIIENQPEFTTNYDPYMFQSNGYLSHESEHLISLAAENNIYYGLPQPLLDPQILCQHPFVKRLLARIQYLENYIFCLNGIDNFLKCQNQ